MSRSIWRCALTHVSAYGDKIHITIVPPPCFFLSSFPFEVFLAHAVITGLNWHSVENIHVFPTLPTEFHHGSFVI
jgi:hypothetical protein